MMKPGLRKLLKKHPDLVHSEMRKKLARTAGAADWIVNTIMIEGCEVPFKYSRKSVIRFLQGKGSI